MVLTVNVYRFSGGLNICCLFGEWGSGLWLFLVKHVTFERRSGCNEVKSGGGGGATFPGGGVDYRLCWLGIIQKNRKIIKINFNN